MLCYKNKEVRQELRAHRNDLSGVESPLGARTVEGHELRGCARGPDERVVSTQVFDENYKRGPSCSRRTIRRAAALAEYPAMLP